MGVINDEIFDCFGSSEVKVKVEDYVFIMILNEFSSLDIKIEKIVRLIYIVNS